MKMIKLSKNKILAVIFCIGLGATAIISDYNVMNYYINDVTGYNEWNSSTNSIFETDYISNFWLKYQYVNLNGAVRNIMGQHEMNWVVKLNNGYLDTNNNYYTDDFINNSACKTAMFEQALADRGIDYVWFTLPYVVDKQNPQMPIGYTDDYGNEDLDRLTEAFKNYGVTTIDLRDNLSEQALETYDIFYKTDHHWTTEGGFGAYNQVIDYVENLYDVEVDDEIRDISNYSITTYDDWHLGSRGQRTGKYFAGIDDFDLILPNFDTYIENYHSPEICGTMQELMINMSPLEKVDYMSRYTYDSVMGGSCGAWHNPNASVDKTVIVISDSMSKAVMPYMALSFTNVIYVGDNDVSVINDGFLETYKPDLIISMDYILCTAYDGAFNWGVY